MADSVPGWREIAAGVGAGFALALVGQAGIWAKAWRRRKEQSGSAISTLDLARLTAAEDAGRQLVTLLRERLDRCERENNDAEKRIQVLEMRNIRLSRAVSMTNWYNAVLRGHIASHGLEPPLMPAIDPSENGDDK